MLSDIEINGGAAVAASGLADALCHEGNCVTRLVNVAGSERKFSWQMRQLSHSIPHKAMRRVMPSPYKVRWERQAAENWLNENLTSLTPDVINIHNMHSATWAGWSENMVRICNKFAPVVWTLHDMWSFTGRCAYSYDCRKFLTGCDATCPTPTEYPALAPSQIAPAWESKRVTLANESGVIAVAPSKWLAQEASIGLWGDNRVKVIPYGISLDTYKPLSQAEALAELGIESNGPVLLVAANDFSERRKGGPVFVEALDQVANIPLTLLIMGKGSLNITHDNIRVCPLGYVSDEAVKRLAYCAADVFVHPALVDNLPNTVLESVACGTPVVGFNIGGLPDMVRAGSTGWLSKSLTPSGLATAINLALTDLQEGNNMRPMCRSVAETEYDANLQARNYSDLFASMIRDRAVQKNN